MLNFAAMFEWFQHMKYCIILLALICGLNGYAQDEDDIAHSINLTEVVVLADGMTFEEYLLKQVLANAKPLKDFLTVVPSPSQPVWQDMAPSFLPSGSISISALRWLRTCSSTRER